MEIFSKNKDKASLLTSQLHRKGDEMKGQIGRNTNISSNPTKGFRTFRSKFPIPFFLALMGLVLAVGLTACGGGGGRGRRGKQWKRWRSGRKHLEGPLPRRPGDQRGLRAFYCRRECRQPRNAPKSEWRTDGRGCARRRIHLLPGWPIGALPGRPECRIYPGTLPG